MNSENRGRHWDTKIHVAIIFASIAAVLVAAGLIAAFALELPMLGWVGFGIVSTIAIGLGVVATVAVPRMRVSAQEPAVAHDQERRLLVIADAQCSEAGLCDEIHARLDGAVAVHLVVPVRVSQESYWLERGLLAKARALTEVAATQVVVSPTAPVAGKRAAT